MMEHLEQTKTDGGNTCSSVRKYRRWSVTLNNYSLEDYNFLVEHFDNINCQYIIGKEVGELKTPHLQCYIEFKNPRHFDAMKKLIPNAHIEAAKSSKKTNFIYCSKEGDFVTNIKDIIIPKKIIDPLDGKILKDFQIEILDLIKQEPNDRIIYWYWESKGAAGKTSLCKHLCLKKKCLILNGKQNDMFNAIITYNTNMGDYPDIIVIDIPRCMQDYVCWGAIEKIKDGLFYSGKYEGGMVIMNCPHVICFANSPPDESKLSKDRWVIKCIEG